MNQILTHCLIKSKSWEYEEEFRLFHWMIEEVNIIKRKLFAHEKLIAICLGLRFETNSEKGKYLLNICKQKNIEIFKMVPKNGFTLEAEKY